MTKLKITEAVKKLNEAGRDYVTKHVILNRIRSNSIWYEESIFQMGDYISHRYIVDLDELLELFQVIPENLVSLIQLSRDLGINPYTLYSKVDRYEIEKHTFEGTKEVYIDSKHIDKLR
jgi:hypothetical protein